MPDLRPFEKISADLLRLIIETGKIGIWKLDLGTGQAWRNHRHDEIFGYPELLPEWTYDMFLEHVIPEDRQRVDDLQRQAVAAGREWLFECRIARADGEERWINAAGRPLKRSDGKVHTLIGNVVDVTRTKRSESRLALLTRELNHRVRNNLAKIKAIIQLSARRADNIEDFSKALADRVEALARTQDILVRDPTRPFTFREILAREVGAYPTLKDRVNLIGQDTVLLNPDLAQGMALIIHELTTNAIKHGAFSVEAGQVDVLIEECRDGGRIQWCERGGPIVEPPDKHGFGSRLIASALGNQGQVELNYRPAGLVCIITHGEFKGAN